MSLPGKTLNLGYSTIIEIDMQKLLSEQQERKIAMTQPNRNCVGTLCVFMFILGFPLNAIAWRNSPYGEDCDAVVWTHDETLTIDTTKFNTALRKEAIVDVATRMNNVGGQWFDWSFAYDSWPEEDETSITMGNCSSGQIACSNASVNTDNCTFNYAWAKLDYSLSWSFDTPGDRGIDYWDAPLTFGSNPTYYFARPVILHELLHMVGLAHSYDFSFTNHSLGAWTNRTKTKMIEPLPDDREGLRAKYPYQGSECDIAVTNWYVDPDAELSYPQNRLCKPAHGNGYSEDIFSTWCPEESPTTSVCPGQLITARWSILNYGTSLVFVYDELWFSTNTDLNTSYDKKSPTTGNRSVNADTTFRTGRKFAVPNTVSYDQEYYLIIRATTSSCTEESDRNNWMPLRGKIYIKPSSQC
jgi:hypothetical protein